MKMIADLRIGTGGTKSVGNRSPVGKVLAVPWVSNDHGSFSVVDHNNSCCHDSSSFSGRV
jgi:hypothetical protein